MIEPDVKTLDEAMRPWAGELLAAEWGSTFVVSRGRAHDASQLPGFVAWLDEAAQGLATYRLDGGECELTSLNSLAPGHGIGAALVAAVRQVALAAGCSRLWAITTNDNTRALRFYQKQGFVLAALHREALALSRQMKPEIPLAGLDGIPLRDEIELEMMLPNPEGAIIASVHHAQITIPPGAEAEGRRFYCQLLGLPEIGKPASLQGRGGFWLQVGDRQVHVGVESGVNRRATKAHLAYQVTDLPAWRQRLAAAGVPVTESIPIPGFDRLELRDPFGNRIELIQPLRAGGQCQGQGPGGREATDGAG